MILNEFLCRLQRLLGSDNCLMGDLARDAADSGGDRFCPLGHAGSCLADGPATGKPQLASGFGAA